MRWYIITNNPLAAQKLGPEAPVELLDTTYEGLLRAVRDRVHAGAVLLTHPLSGSVKPRETPYKSVILQDRQGPVDERSLSLIENALAACEKFQYKTGYPPSVDNDFQLIDWTLLESGLASVTR